MELLHASHLSHAYEYPLFDDISLTLGEKESYAVIGVSGSGKSTILHILSTLLKPQKGSVKIFGKEMYELDDDAILKIRRYDIGIIFQFHYLFKGFSAYENIEIASILTDKTINPIYLQKLHIEHLLHQPIGELSGGQQQRISIARILSKQPKIIFADEPTGNLDKETAKEVMDILFEYIQTHNAALFLVTHDEQLARKCTHVTRLKDQKLIEVS